MDWAQALQHEAQARVDRLVELTAELVRIPSVSGSEQQVVKRVAEWGRSAGLDTRLITPHLEQLREHPAFTPPAGTDYEGRDDVVVTVGAPDGPSLALYAHLDVVPVDPNTEWSYDPWGGEVMDGRIYGRGSSDCKGGAAVAMVACEILRDLAPPMHGSLQAQFVVEEEAGGNGTLAAIMAGVRADAMIQLEPTGTRSLIVSNRGAQFFRIRVPGVEAGVEYQHSLSSAIDNAIVVVEAVRAYSLMREATIQHPLYSGLSGVETPMLGETIAPLAVCRFMAGEWPSTVPGKAVLEGTIECMPGESLEAVVSDFEAYLARIASQHPFLSAHPPVFERFGLMLEPAAIPVDSPIVTAISRASAQVLGYQPSVIGGGGSDLRLPVLYANCPTVLYGPSGGMIHSVDEYVEVDQLLNCLRVILATACDWLVE